MSVCLITAYSKPKNNIRTSQGLHVQVIHIFFSDQDTAASVTTDATTLPNPDTTGKKYNILRLWRELHASFCRGGNSSAFTYVNYHITSVTKCTIVKK